MAPPTLEQLVAGIKPKKKKRVRFAVCSDEASMDQHSAAAAAAEELPAGSSGKKARRHQRVEDVPRLP